MNVLNILSPLSVNQGRILAMYEGAKDKYEPMKMVFQEIFDEFKDIQRNICDLDIKTPTMQCKNNKFRTSANVLSLDCKSCVYFSTSEGFFRPRLPINWINIPEKPVDKLFLSYGGDYEGLVQLLGKIIRFSLFGA